MNGRPRPSAIVLAGGGSTRFGSDKLAADVDGQPLLHRAIQSVAGTCSEVVLVVGPDGVPALPTGLEVMLRIARDEVAGGGPLVGLVAGLEECASPTVVVIGGDMPAVMPDVLVQLHGRLVDLPDAVGATALLDGDRPRPLPCAVRRDAALPAARALLADGRSSLRGLLETLGVDAIPEADWRRLDPGGRSLLDVDRPEDLARLEALPLTGE